MPRDPDHPLTWPLPLKGERGREKASLLGGEKAHDLAGTLGRREFGEAIIIRLKT